MTAIIEVTKERQSDRRSLGNRHAVAGKSVTRRNEEKALLIAGNTFYCLCCHNEEAGGWGVETRIV